ncbi:ketopantoate reductase family protein [Pseudonocardia sp. CA-107938]|uniref:ketopantoate reductase family protein n=1 Tax=Pseudonocardia sp. CA-107938 TaxID=3240021 RepID=UPI003D91D4A3
MRYVIVGAGSVGAVIGGRLAEAGSDVLLVARGAHLAALASAGLRLEEPDRARTIAVPAAAQADWRPGDVALVCVKSQDTAAALRDVPRDVPVVCAQNGVANERWAHAAGFADVYAMCVVLPAELVEPGVVVNSFGPAPGLLDVGRWPDGVDERAERIVADLGAAGFRGRAEPAVMRWKYRKLVTNLGNAADAACDPDDPELDALVRTARAEGERAVEAAGIPIASRAEDRERRGDLRILPVAGRDREGSSTRQSLRRGSTSVEVDFLNGEIVALGARHGIATPVNAVLQATLAEMAAAGEAPGSRRAADLLAEAAVRTP